MTVERFVLWRRIPLSPRASWRFLFAFCGMGCVVLSGCSRVYNGERLFWKAQQLSVPIEKDPSHATDEQFAKTIRAFERVTQEAPGTPSAAQAQYYIGTLYAFRKQYDESRRRYAVVLQNYFPYQPLCSAARWSIARTYELEQKWDLAVRAYREVAEYHPWSQLGLQVPLYVAAGYQKRDDPERAQETYQYAVKWYNRLVANAPSEESATQVEGFLVLAYQKLGQWNNTIRLLEKLTSTPRGGTNRPLLLLNLGTIYQMKLGNPERARGAYVKLIREFPDHPFTKIAKSHLEKIGP